MSISDTTQDELEEQQKETALAQSSTWISSSGANSWFPPCPTLLNLGKILNPKKKTIWTFYILKYFFNRI
jgi:hypothetical protein